MLKTYFLHIKSKKRIIFSIYSQRIAEFSFEFLPASSKNRIVN